MQRMYRYGANITGSNPYWFPRTQELEAVFATKGCANLFFTLSAADNHWSDWHRLMPPGYDESPAGHRRAVIDSPHIVDSFFGARVDAFTSALFDGVLKAKWKWYWHEYQGKGGIHTHGCVKLDYDPGLVELTAVAYAGVLAKRKLDDDNSHLDAEERQHCVCFLLFKPRLIRQ